MVMACSESNYYCDGKGLANLITGMRIRSGLCNLFIIYCSGLCKFLLFIALDCVNFYLLFGTV
jgi:hypothetical protein